MSAGHHIYLLDPVFSDPLVRDGARPELDLPVDFGFLLNDNIAELNKNGSFKVEQIIPFGLPATQKNKAYLEQFSTLNLSEGAFRSARVEVHVFGVVLRQNVLFVTNYNDAPETYNCELSEGENHWLYKLEQLYLKDLDLGTFLFTEANIEDIIQNGAIYLDGADPIHFPLIDFGRFNYEDGDAITYEYFRPVHAPLAILREGFKFINKGFECPFLETETGRRMWKYILAPNFYELIENNSVDFFGLEVEYEIISGDWTVNQIGSELGGFTNNALTPTFSFAAPVDRDLNYVFSFNGFVTNLALANADFNWQVGYVDSGGFFISLWETEDQTLLPSQVIEENFESPPITLPEGEQILVIFNRTDPSVTPVTGYVITGRGDDPVIYLGTEFDVAGIIGQEYTFLDFLAGVAHEIRGKLHYDRINEKFYLYTPQDIVLDSEQVPGYLRATQPAQVVVPLKDTTVVTYPSKVDNRFVRLKFKDSSDNYIDLQNLPEEPHSRLIDLGDKGRFQTVEEISNPFFEPTIERKAYQFNKPLSAPSIPVMWDNDEGELSFDIKPRSLWAVGYVKQWNEQGNQYAQWKVKTVAREELPYASNKPEAQYGDPLESAPFAPVYGTYEIDLFAIAWQYVLAEFAGAATVRAEIEYELDDYFDQDKFRAVYQLLREDETISARLNSIVEFDTKHRRVGIAEYIQRK